MLAITIAPPASAAVLTVRLWEVRTGFPNLAYLPQVKLGYAELVAAMTSTIVRTDRADVVAKITLELMMAGAAAA